MNKTYTTYHPNGQVKSHTEYDNHIEISHKEYDTDGNKTFFRGNNGYWYVRTFDENKEVTFFIDTHNH